MELQLKSNSKVYFGNETYTLSDDVNVDLAGVGSTIKEIIFNATSKTFSTVNYNANLGCDEYIVMLMKVKESTAAQFSTVYHIVAPFECNVNDSPRFVTKSDFDTFIKEEFGLVKNQSKLVPMSIAGTGISISTSNMTLSIGKQCIVYYNNTKYIVSSAITVDLSGISSGYKKVVFNTDTKAFSAKKFDVDLTDDEVLIMILKTDNSGGTFTQVNGIIANCTVKVDGKEWLVNQKTLAETREEIESEIGGILIPDYFTTQVDNAVMAATNDIATAGINGDNFIFITDIHWENNFKNSPRLVQYICNKMNIPYILFGGDAINGQDDTAVAMEYFNEIASGLKKAESKLFSVYGNHDNNATNTTFPSGLNVFYSLLQKQSDMLMNYGELCYFYFDNPTNKTRYICLSVGQGMSFSSNQETWLRELLTNTDTSTHIIIVLHAYMRGTNYEESGVVVGSEFIINVAGTAVNNIISDYPNLKFEAVLSGHVHFDYNGMTDSMVPVIFTTCDRWKSNEDEGTINEQAFDIDTIDYTNKLIVCRRIGRGKSRIIHYTPYSINVSENLDISNLVTIVPTSYSIRDNMHVVTMRSSGEQVFFNSNATISKAGVVTGVAVGYVTAVAENDDFIETFNIKIS
jgi:hypothetical protein